MPKALSLHIGLDAVDPSQYEGWDGRLMACEADARDMRAIAGKQKFTQSLFLLTTQASSTTVKFVLSDIAKLLTPGDLFWLTYSGHGAQVPDRNGDDKDRQDETWVLFDRMLVDDELYSLFAKFKPGVRILVLSDSCHSGTVTRKKWPRKLLLGYGHFEHRARLMPPDVNARVYAAHKKAYDEIQRAVKPAARVSVKASVILISGCQDNQLAEDGDRNGLFTGQLLKTWNNGKFRGSYRQFRNEIAAKMPDYQSPNYYTIGQPMAAFEKSKPFQG